MIFWVLVSLLTAAVAMALLMPLLRGRPASGIEMRGDIAVYRDQLAEIERDRAAGLIAAEDAERARAEIGRRLIAATDAQAHRTDPDRRPRATKAAQAVIVLLLPVLCLGIYLSEGSPDLPDQPLAARLASPDGDVEVLIARVEAALAVNPADGAGWEVLAPVYARRGRFPDAAEAYRKAIQYLGETPERLTSLAETLIAAAGGQVVPEARQALERSAALSPDDPRTRFYLALGLEQNGQAAAARDAFTKLAASAPVDAPWLPLVRQHLARLGPAGASPSTAATAPGPGEQEIAAAAAMNEEDRQRMIEDMVGGLAARLKARPDDAEGWQRLVRSYMVLGRPEEARSALKEGLARFPADGEAGQALIALAKSLGLSQEGP
ncbi:c-type cytochrome biogenesis protein CcmI [Rhizobium rhizosphaerae]|uniref:C-type cytochrome biogenesis protein CcmI n=1 Tax=Xaviernesmea rhizosphaerae TaxID=1672749 RepID=A0ABX3PAC7_9HYPH|nr:c-type cytochrome biogenesis protein CcmI [Xaviernesmea rhizosphaerae]OQP85104.1 c-type cytochrome biogenesis protein CcmI [Xaviernesmea rhizosphaerae]